MHYIEDFGVVSTRNTKYFFRDSDLEVGYGKNSDTLMKQISRLPKMLHAAVKYEPPGESRAQ